MKNMPYVSRVIMSDNNQNPKKMKIKLTKEQFNDVKETIISDFQDELESAIEYGENGYGEDEEFFTSLIEELEECETPEEMIEVIESFGRGDYSDMFLDEQ